MTLAAVAGLSLSSIAFEVLLTRYFSIAHWSHLSFLAISIAMFGVAAGGTFQCLAGSGWRQRAERDGPAFFALLSVCGAVATFGAFLLVKIIPLDYLRFPVDAAQVPWLLLSYMVLSLPFFVSGVASCTAFAMEPERSGAISFAAMLGSGAGALLPLFLIPWFGDGGSVAAASFVPLLPPLAARGRGRVRVAALAIALLLCGFTAWQRTGALSIEPSAYKTLPLLLQAPGTRIVDRSDSILGRLEEIESPLIRFAPGLSLGYTGALPPQKALISDGDAMSVLYDLPGPESASFARWTHMFAAFVLEDHAAPSSPGPARAPLRALVLQRDGGLAFACAVAAGAQQTTLVVQDPRVARRVKKHYRMPNVSVVAENARSYLAGGDERFDAILLESWGPSLPGMASLAEDSLLTTDAFSACWRRLGSEGVLAVARRIILPPSDSLRIFATALKALRMAGVSEPENHLAVIRGWDTCTLLISRAAIQGDAFARLKRFAETASFDLDYYPGIVLAEANRFSKYDKPYFTEAYLGFLSNPLFAERYFLDIVPQSDDRPFPARFLKWARLGDFRRATGGRAYTLLLTGDVVAGVTFLEAIGVGLALVAATLLLARRKHARTGGPAFLLLSACVGAGFLFAEIFIVDSLTLLFASPSVALAIALGGLLFSSGIGGLFSERVRHCDLKLALALVAAVVALLSLLLPWLFSLLLPLAAPVRLIVSLLMTVVPGVLIGMPFPAAMRLLAAGDEDRASAWAMNGCASVAATVSSALIASAAGIRSLFLISAGMYAFAAATAFLARRSIPR
jgi:hypothetical protein